MEQNQIIGFNKEIIDILSKITRIELKGITYDTLIFEELGIDSLMAIEILARVEKQFDIIIEESLLADFNTVGDFVHKIEEKIKCGIRK
jgi:acyl carrier protein